MPFSCASDNPQIAGSHRAYKKLQTTGKTRIVRPDGEQTPSQGFGFDGGTCHFEGGTTTAPSGCTM